MSEPKLKFLPVLQNTDQVVRFARGMLFLPARHTRWFSGSPKQPGLFRDLKFPATITVILTANF